MKFAKQMLVRMEPSWSDKYVHYDRLKLLILEVGKLAMGPLTVSETPLADGSNGKVAETTGTDSTATPAPSGQTTSSATPLVSPQEALKKIAELIGTFEETLAKDLETIDEFYAQEMAKLVTEGAVLIQEKKHDRNTLLDFREKFMRLFDYAIVNKVAFGKILKKWQRWLGEVLPPSTNLDVVAWAEKVDKAKFQDTHEGLSLLELLATLLERKPPMVRRPSDFSQFEETDKRVLLDEIDFHDFLPGRIHRIWLSMTMDAFSRSLKIPIIVARGMFSGPILGITAAVHGNELNGIPLIHRLIKELDMETLHGTIVFVPVVNNPGFMRCSRNFSDGQDLNRVFPGKPDGDSGNQYAFQFTNKVVRKLEYLIDLHTASHGRVNSLYVRANLLDPLARRMAILQNPQIAVHNSGPDGSLRGAAAKLNIPAITVEIGNPLVFQRRYIKHALVGVYNIMVFLHMMPAEARNEPPEVDPVVCGRSTWSYAEVGGLMVVHPEVNTWVRQGEKIATIHDVFGDHLRDYYAAEDGIVIGKNVNPIIQAGDRIIHLGVVTAKLKQNQNDGHR